MPHYEILFILPVSLEEEEQKEATQKVVDFIKKRGGGITKENVIGRKKLAYAINHQHQGIYVCLEFDLPADMLSEVNKEFQLFSELIRFQVVKKPVQTPEQIAKTKKIQEKIEEKKKEEIEKEIEEKEKKEEKKEVTKKEDKEQVKKKVSLEDLDEKLDKILEDDLSDQV